MSELLNFAFGWMEGLCHASWHFPPQLAEYSGSETEKNHLHYISHSKKGKEKNLIQKSFQVLLLLIVSQSFDFMQMRC